MYAMFAVGRIHDVRKDHKQAVEWYSKGAEAGLPKAMFGIGCCLEEGKGVAAPDHLAAVVWYRRAADAGHAFAAANLGQMYSLGRGWAWHVMPATSSATF